MPDLTLTGLRILREVATQGSFTAAAATLGYTQSAVSRQVAGLEDAAGSPLFERTPRGVRLTDAGAALLRRADRVLAEVGAAKRELDGMSELATGRLRVGAFPTAVAALLPRALSAFRERHPGVAVTLREGGTASQLRRLLAGATELAVISVPPSGDPPRDRKLALEHLLDDPLLLAVGRDHPLAQRRTVEVDDLAEEDWIVAAANAADTFLGAWEWAEWRPRVEFTVREWTAKLGLVAVGLGVTLVPGLATSAVRDDVSLLRIRGERPASRAVLLATRSGEEPGPHRRAFGELLHQSASELALELQARVRGR